MPITAKLSRNFYDKFGEDIANEIVDWLNTIGPEHRTEPRELNDHNCMRFEAKFAQAPAEHGASLRGAPTEQVASLCMEVARMEQRLGERISSLELRTEQALAMLEQRLSDKISSAELGLTRALAIQTRWIIGLCLAQSSFLGGTIFVLLQR